MRVVTCACCVLVSIALATPATAQSTTEDGIRAMVGGDYAAAARILKPLADVTARPDPVAQFFLAILYETGQGVRADMLRACGLFVASSEQPHPFAEQSGAIAAGLRAQFGDGRFCVPDKWQGGPPQSFTPGPGHRVVFADTSITVTHGDKEERMMHMLPPGAAVLPIQHTPLTVTKPVAARRDFFQWFYWMPDRPLNPTSWTLNWMLSEVAGEVWIGLAGEESLFVVKGSTRPELDDVSKFIRLQVNANGEAEFTTVGATSPRTDVIPWQGGR